jgi:predicted HicB family RNase H-like nuclease
VLAFCKQALISLGIDEMTQLADRMTITIRTTKELHKRLAAQAKRSRRSLNREAELLLERALEAEESKARAEKGRKE